MSHPTTIPELLAIGNSGNDAIGAPGKPALTYGGLRQTVASGVATLERAGLGRKDRIVIVLANGPEAAVAFLTAASASIACPLNPGFTESEFRFALSDLAASALMVEGPSPARDAAKELGIPALEVTAGSHAGDIHIGIERATNANATQPTMAEPGNEALSLHTSGTTARPKLVPLCHVNLCASARNVATSLGLTPADRCLNVMPLFHVHGLIAAMASSLYAGASIWCGPGFNGLKFFDWLGEAKATWMTAVPTIYQAILGRAERNADAVAANPFRFLRSSSAAMPTSVLERLELAFDAPLVESYGMTEAAQQICANPLPPETRKPGTVGPPAGPEVAILDERGSLLATGATGEVAIKGDNVMGGYFDNPAANAEAFTNGWLRTGDLGWLDNDGYLTLAGRAKEVINRGGEKISPAEVEDVFLRHEAVREAAVFALPHPSLGEEPAAAVVLSGGGGASADELREFAAGLLAGFKVPRRVIVVDELPKGPTGKVARTTLAKRLGLIDP